MGKFETNMEFAGEPELALFIEWIVGKFFDEVVRKRNEKSMKPLEKEKF